MYDGNDDDDDKWSLEIASPSSTPTVPNQNTNTTRMSKTTKPSLYCKENSVCLEVFLVVLSRDNFQNIPISMQLQLHCERENHIISVEPVRKRPISESIHDLSVISLWIDVVGTFRWETRREIKYCSGNNFILIEILIVIPLSYGTGRSAGNVNGTSRPVSTIQKVPEPLTPAHTHNMVKITPNVLTGMVIF